MLMSNLLSIFVNDEMNALQSSRQNDDDDDDDDDAVKQWYEY